MRKEKGICQHPATIIVDVANVMGSRPDGWWRDRAAAAVRLHTEITALAAEGTAAAEGPPWRRRAPPWRRRAPPWRRRAPPGAEGTRWREGTASETGPPQFVMVLEGAARAAAARIDAAQIGLADRVRVVQADGSGDDAIVALVRELPGRRFVVTADRELRRRCEAAGATVLGPGWLLGLVRRGDRR